MKQSLILAAMLCLAALPARAAPDAKKIGTYGAWTAYSYTEDGKKVCYMAANPTSSQGEYTKRGNVFAMITHRPADKALDVFSFMAGYDYKSGAPVTVSIDGMVITLIGADEVAWTPDDATDRKLSEALRRGKKMTVSGISGRGTETKDVFSLSGTGSAYATIGKACDVAQ